MIFVEIVDRRGQVRDRKRVDSLPFLLGRAYHNDLILDDPYVSPVHAQIEAGGPGGFVLRDLDSQNGIHASTGESQNGAVALQVPCEFQLGRTRCRLRDVRHVVAPALLDPTTNGWGWLLRQPAAGLLILLAVAATIVGDQLRASQRALDWGRLAESFLTSALLIALWVGLWALITRVLTPRTRFLGHWIVAGSYTLFEAGMRWAGAWFRFFVAAITPLQIFEIALHFGVAAFLFYAHISLTGALRPARRAMLAGLLSVAFVSISQLDTVFRRPDWVQVLPYWSQLQPVDPKWLPVTEPDVFFEDTDAIRASLEALVRRSPEAPAAAAPASPPATSEDTP